MRAALRRVLERAPGVRAVTTHAPPLEQLAGDAEPPRLVDARGIEDATLRARPVPGEPTVGFAAFLDGRQESRVLAWDGVAPVVEGRVSAVIRARHQRRLGTWREPLLEYRLYLPLSYSRAPWGEVFPAAALVDTSAPAADGTVPPPHPTLLVERARFAVSRDREAVERRLAERWCAEEERPLFIDGGIGGSQVMATAPCAVGVVKSHRTMYVDARGLEVVLALRKGERTSAILITPRDRSRVVSWYLRLRDPAGADALWGVVRVEVAETDDVTRRADEVSRWVLADSLPLAMPDPRWDRMAYGVRDAEQFLRSISPASLP